MQNQKSGANTQKLEPDLHGMAGEIAVAKACNRFPDLSIGPHRRGYDLTIKGRKVDVKTTTYNPGYLQCKLHKKLEDADVYILVTAALPHYTIQGGATAQDLLQDINVRDTGYGSFYTLEQSQLMTLPQLFKNKYAQSC
tara:strand:- start:46 stop:462 length:417 start_codon:yes stop_codon:yes gene_type:complete